MNSSGDWRVSDPEFRERWCKIKIKQKLCSSVQQANLDPKLIWTPFWSPPTPEKDICLFRRCTVFTCGLNTSSGLWFVLSASPTQHGRHSERWARTGTGVISPVIFQWSLLHWQTSKKAYWMNESIYWNRKAEITAGTSQATLGFDIIKSTKRKNNNLHLYAHTVTTYMHIHIHCKHTYMSL